MSTDPTEKPSAPGMGVRAADGSRLRLALGLAVAVVAISFAAIFIRLAQAEGMPSLAIAAWRLTLASALLLPYAWTRCGQEIRGISGREWRLLAGAGAFLGFHFITWIASLRYTSVASSVVLVTTGPVFVGLGSWLLLRERPGAGTVTGIAVAVAGSLAIGWGDLARSQLHLLGDGLALLGAVMMAGYLMIGRRVRAGRSLLAYSAIVYGLAAATVLILAVATGQPLFGFSLAGYGWVLAMALVSQLVGHSVLNWALRHISATYVAMTTMAEPIGSGLLAYLVFGEAVATWTLAGGALILAGIFIASRDELRSGARMERR
jgi:drug/metabolite transporter (DMT)-like permease